MSKSNKKDVGKGIRALLANIDKKSDADKKDSTKKKDQAVMSEIVIHHIEINPFQPRVDFDEDELSDLAESIKTHGLIQPITVRRLNARKYQIISGERRWRAAQIAGLKTLPVYIRETDDQGMLEMSLLENIQRTDLNPMEVAISFQRLIDECDLTHEALSSRLGKKRSSITNYLRLLRLAPSVQKAVKEQVITMGHAKLLAGIKEPEKQAMVLGEIISKGLSVRGTELLVKGQMALRKEKPDKSKKSKHPEVERIIDELSDFIGNRIRIDRSDSGRGFIKISFSSDREFNEIVDRILDR